MRHWWNVYTTSLSLVARKGLGVQVPHGAPFKKATLTSLKKTNTRYTPTYDKNNPIHRHTHHPPQIG